MLALRVRPCALPRALVHRPHVGSVGHQSRSFLNGRPISKYWMKRAKILHIMGRMVVAYPQMHYIPDPDAPINQLFARNAGERERVFMFVLCQVPPDEPIDLAEFVGGASDAARRICTELYDGDETAAVLETMALPKCVATWKEKTAQLRKLVRASDAATLRLESIAIQHAGLAEVNYTYSDAKGKSDEEEAGDQKERMSLPQPQPSKFIMHEAIQIKVQFDVREHLRVQEPDAKETTLPTERVVAVDSSFEWTFESDVSREEVVDWVITSASPFTSTLAPKDDTVDDIAEDIEETL